MSVRLGMIIFLHHQHKAIKQVGDVVRAWRSLRMTLEAKCGAIRARKTLQRTVKERFVCNAAIGGQKSLYRLRTHDFAM